MVPDLSHLAVLCPVTETLAAGRAALRGAARRGGARVIVRADHTPRHSAAGTSVRVTSRYHSRGAHLLRTAPPTFMNRSSEIFMTPPSVDRSDVAKRYN